MLKPRDAQSVTSLMLKREMENARRELRNLKTGQHENERDNAAGEMTMDGEDRARANWTATYDPRCETCVEVGGVSTHPRKAVAEAAYFDFATVKNSKQGAEVKILVGAGPRGATFARAVHRNVMETFQCTVINKSVCVKLYTVQLEDWDCQQD